MKVKKKRKRMRQCTEDYKFLTEICDENMVIISQLPVTKNRLFTELFL